MAGDGRSPIARLLLVVVVATMSMGLMACSSGTQRDGQSTGESPRPETTGTSERAGVPESEAERTTPGAPATWDYVALGDSLAAGVGARRGYVDRYAEDLRAETGARVRVANLGVSGQTASQLLRALRDDPSVRRALREAEVITFNIGINDLGRARASYEAETCGGARDRRCLGAALEVFQTSWDAITGEILSLRSADEAIIRTAGLGYTPRVDGVYEPYLREANRHIAASAAENGIPHAEVSLGDRGIGADGLHPDGHGYEAIADRLARFGYEPLGPR
jgi:lysophospholipase L1-like esterase